MHDAILMIAASEKDANLYYATRFFAPDPFIYTEIRGQRYVFMSDLEFDRAKSEAKVDDVLSTSLFAKRLAKHHVEPTLTNIVDALFRDEKVKEVLVPANFGFAYGERLRKKGYHLTTKAEPFFEERLFKTEEEVAKITETQRAIETAVEEGIRTIARSRISNA